jgi:hypothetical protein
MKAGPMRILVHPGEVTLDDPADCTRFHAVHDGPVALDAALRAAGAGYADGAGAMIDVDWLRGQARGRVGATWQADCAAMLDYVATKGWLSPDRGHVRAHVEQLLPDPAGIT